MAKIGIYGGTFNPPHFGHVNLAKNAIKALELDKLLIIPTALPPHKSADESVEQSERLEMTRIAFEEVKDAVVSDIELRRGGISYTIDTLNEIKRLVGPEDKLYLLMGSDMFNMIEKWRQFKDIFKLCTIAVFERENGDTKLSEYVLYIKEKYNADIVFIEAPVIEMSSENIRTMLRCGCNMGHVLPYKLAQYIADKNVYLPELEVMLSEVLSRKRFLHSVSVRDESIKLARIYNVDIAKAALAGLLHDITKEKTYDEQLQLCKEFGIILSTVEKNAPKLLHAKTGAYYIREKLGIDDEDIFAAVYYHTTGRAGMSPLEEVIFLADFIEPLRDFDGVDSIRQYAYTDLNKAIVTACDISIDEVRNNNMTVHENTLSARAYYAGRNNML
ncbi:MAG: nicotinate (nicotinamide) nucleotide adenylyltransferase [Bacillota bacterium]|nr:nicotinate (nicotinamide) nucleotide adenylyltransferase [Bacillota bacterium]